MALVNPNIAMSFKPTTEYQPRNALADYAQMQQIQTGDMQMQEYRRKSEGLERIRTAISKAGGPDDLETAAQEMMKVPEYFNQGYEIYQTIRDKKAFEEYLKGKGQPAGTSPVGAPTAARPTPALGALGSGTFDPSAPAASYRVMGTDTDRPLMDKVYQVGQSAPLDTRQRGFSSTAPTNALTPATATAPVAAPTNALVNPVEAIESEIMQLSRFKDPRAQARVKQLERQLAAMEPTPDLKAMKALGYPLTAQGYADYTNAKKPEGLLSPEEEAQRIRIANASRAPRAERAPRTQVTQLEDGSIALVNLDTGQVVPAAMAGQQVKGKGSKDKDATVSEQQAAYNTNRVLTAATEIARIVKEDPGALKPGVMEALPGSVGMSGTANLARSANRQTVFGAQRDALDALLYLSTGAAYNKEQLEGISTAYVPSFTDKAETIKAKQQRMAQLIQAAKIRAGKAWTPEMEAASQILIDPTAAPKTPAKPTASPYSNLSDEELLKQLSGGK